MPSSKVFTDGTSLALRRDTVSHCYSSDDFQYSTQVHHFAMWTISSISGDSHPSGVSAVYSSTLHTLVHAPCLSLPSATCLWTFGSHLPTNSAMNSAAFFKLWPLALGPWPLALALGSGPWLWPLALALGSGPWLWALALGPWLWPLALGPWLWPLALALGSGPWLWPLALALGSGPWLWPLALALGSGPWLWPLALGSGPWLLALGSGPWLWPLALALGSGPWLWPLALALGSGPWLWPLALALGSGPWLWPLALALGSGPWLWPLALALGSGPWLWPLALALGSGSGPCLWLRHLLYTLHLACGPFLANVVALQVNPRSFQLASFQACIPCGSIP